MDKIYIIYDKEDGQPFFKGTAKQCKNWWWKQLMQDDDVGGFRLDSLNKWRKEKSNNNWEYSLRNI